MSGLVFEAPAMSGENIEDLADLIRGHCGFEDEPYFPVVRFMEHGLHLLVEGLTFEIAAIDQLGAAMGAVHPAKRELLIREDVYEKAAAGKGRDRFTVAHEIGHAILHIELDTLNRVASNQTIPAYKNPEWQANRFAAALLMPRKLVRRFNSLTAIVRDFGVSRQSADLRARQLLMEVE